jgi:hypothetical protein
MSHSTKHNLDIYSYSFTDILDLFHLKPRFNESDLKHAKLIALRTHPDKSGLLPQYFLFYKKAYDIVLEYYKNTQKTEAIVPNENPVYSSEQTPIKSVQQSISSVENTKQFNDRFNELYDKNMKTQIDTEKNRWFKDETPVYDIKVSSISGIHGAIDNIKQTSSALSKYQGVQEMTLLSSGSALYEEDSDETYVTCDPFSKLKFDDLRKVHKDHTVLAVSERDFDSSKTFGSTDEIRSARENQRLTPLEKGSAEKILKESENKKQELLLKRQHTAHLQTMRFEEKNSIILAEFLRLGN